MDIRDQAIEILQESGYHAFKRDWSPGESVIAFAVPVDNTLGIKAWRHSVCIYQEDASWVAVDMAPQVWEPQYRDTIEEAAIEAVRILDSKTRK